MKSILELFGPNVPIPAIERILRDYNSDVLLKTQRKMTLHGQRQDFAILELEHPSPLDHTALTRHLETLPLHPRAHLRLEQATAPTWIDGQPFQIQPDVIQCSELAMHCRIAGGTIRAIATHSSNTIPQFCRSVEAIVQTPTNLSQPTLGLLNEIVTNGSELETLIQTSCSQNHSPPQLRETS